MSAEQPRLWRGHTRRVWLLWALATLALVAVPLALSDPALLALVLDPELFALVLIVGIAAIKLNAQLLLMRLRTIIRR